MGAIKDKTRASDRKKWHKIFNATVEIVRTQQSQLETLVEEKKRLEERIRLQYDRWIFDVRQLEDQISQMKEKLLISGKACSYEVAKAIFLRCSKNKEASLRKRRLENAESELADFISWFDILSRGCPEQEDLPPPLDILTLKGPKNLHKKLENEVRRLRLQCEKLDSRQSSEVSTLKSENNFVWNQYKLMESNYTNQLQIKSDEIKAANEKISELLSNMEELSSSSKEKDDKITSLQTSIAQLEAEAVKKDGEILKLAKALQSLKESRKDFITPVLNHCTNKTNVSSSMNKLSTAGKEKSVKTEETLRRSQRLCTTEPEASNPENKRGNAVVKKEASSTKELFEQISQIVKRKRDDNAIQSPRLFTSGFKIPKLKNHSLSR